MGDIDCAISTKSHETWPLVLLLVCAYLVMLIGFPLSNWITKHSEIMDLIITFVVSRTFRNQLNSVAAIADFHQV